MSNGGVLRKIKMKARELADVDVQFVSLVERGANRTPFKILKKEEPDMSIDLSTLFFRKPAPPPAPVISAVLLNKGEDVTAWSKMLSDNGYSFPVQVVDEESGVSVLKSDEGEVTGVTIGLSDGVAIAVQHVEKGLDPYPASLSFKENISKSGFFPGVSIAMDAFMNTLFKIASSEGDQGETVGLIEKALSDFSGYVTSLVNKLPKSVFKLEHDMIEAAASAPSVVTVEKGDEPESVVGGDEEETEVSDPPTEETVVKDEEVSVENEAEKPVTAESGTEPEKPEVVEKDSDPQDQPSEEVDVMAELAESVRKMSEGLGALAAAVEKTDGETKGAIEALRNEMTQKIAEVSGVAKKTEEALSGLVATDLTPPDAQPTRKTKKSDDGEVGLFDSVLRFDGFERR